MSTPAPQPAAARRDRRFLRRLAAAVSCAALLSVLGVTGAPATAGADTTFTFTGGGWGHGVGMSQYGACGQAAKGAGAGQILAHYFRGTTITTMAEATDLRIRLTESTSFTLGTSGTTTFWGVGTVPAGRTVEVRRSGGSVVLSGAINATVGGSLVVTSAGSPLRVSPPGRRFQTGALVVATHGSSSLSATIVGLTMRDYLAGLGEVPSLWPTEALRAQIIAARTIAQGKAARAGRGDADYDLDSRLDGVFIGYERIAGGSSSRWEAAVDSTRGKVITYGGSPITVTYHSSSGGYTENSEVVWVAALPYLKGVPDPEDAGCGNTRNRWAKDFSGSSLGSRLGIGAVTSFSSSGTPGVSGRIDRVTFTFRDSTGRTARLSGAQLKSRLGLWSTKFRLAAGQSNRPPTGSIIDIRAADRRRILVGGTASDPDGTPKVFISAQSGQNTIWQLAEPVGGMFLHGFSAPAGTHRVCVALLDAPTGEASLLGCRNVVVK